MTLPLGVPAGRRLRLAVPFALSAARLRVTNDFCLYYRFMVRTDLGAWHIDRSLPLAQTQRPVAMQPVEMPVEMHIDMPSGL